MPTSEPTQEHFNATRLRTHTWDRLKTAVSDLAVAKSGTSGSVGEVDVLLQDLQVIEQYWAFPGREAVDGLRAMLVRKEYAALETRVLKLVRTLVSGQIRLNTGQHVEYAQDHEDDNQERPRTKYFEVLFVDDLNEKEERELKENLADVREPNDPFTYDVIVVPTVQDALIALLFNSNIQACVIRYGMPFASANAQGFLRDYIRAIKEVDLSDRNKADMGPLLGKLMRWFRPEVDRYYVTDTPVSDLKDTTVQNFRRIFYRQEDHQELHLNLLRGVQEKYDTPFFTALMDYSRRPMGVFHAMPISRGNSVFKSRWIQDFGDFYGRNLFLAETSSTSGGLDSLLQPTGPLKKAQERAARAFGAQFTYFATNGTSTSNKIVLQALVEPHDMVLIDRDCHKSHHYGLVLSGAYPVYLDSYPLPDYSMYGAVPLEVIREKLLELKRAGRLHHVKMLLLTNCTFDGVVYNVQRVMEQVLAIKPDMIFLWDEAWFAFAGFSYIFKQRTAMFSAARLHRKYHSDAYREEYADHGRPYGGRVGGELAFQKPQPPRHRAEHAALEEALAAWTGRERALLFSTGYMANLGIQQALLTRGDVCVQDKLNHACLLDGARLSGAELKRYPHADLTAAARQLATHPQAAALLATDGVFSMDGDTAPLRELADLCQRERATFMVDDAHGLGVFGIDGAGSINAAGLNAHDAPVLMATLGKALGCAGAFVAGSAALIEGLIQQARPYIYTTAMPPALAGATLCAVKLAQTEAWRREKLFALIARFRAGAAQLGLPLLPSSSAIQPLLLGDAQTALDTALALEQQGFLVTAIRSPTVPSGSARLRITLSAAHSETQVDQLLAALETLRLDIAIA